MRNGLEDFERSRGGSVSGALTDGKGSIASLGEHKENVAGVRFVLIVDVRTAISGLDRLCDIVGDFASDLASPCKLEDVNARRNVPGPIDFDARRVGLEWIGGR